MLPAAVSVAGAEGLMSTQMPWNSWRDDRFMEAAPRRRSAVSR
jgi:hypothetical protein